MDFLYCGGGQEGGNRPGTENTAAAYGFALAAEKHLNTMESEYDRILRLKEYMIGELKSLPGAQLIPPEKAPCSPYIAMLSFPPIPGEILVRILKDRDIMISTGSACSSKHPKKTRVLEYMDIPPEWRSSSIRISMGRQTRQSDIDNLISVMKIKVPELLEVARG